MGFLQWFHSSGVPLHSRGSGGETQPCGPRDSNSLARSLDRQLMLASVDFFNVVRLFVLMNATRYFEYVVVDLFHLL